MSFSQIKSYAKINLALNIVGKTTNLHKIESIIAFIDLYDLIFIKKIKSKKNYISFSGKFSRNIGKKKYCFRINENSRKKKNSLKIKNFILK